jgi:hypothetical protein
VDPITESDISDLGSYQTLDADLTSWAGVTRAAGFDTFTATPTTANFLSLVTDETFVMDADIGTTVQAYDADLTTWAGITPGANVGTFLATPTIANLSTALSDATISGNNTGDEVVATAGEINTGTEAVKYISPDALAGSNLGTFVLSIVLFNPAEDVVTGDAAATFTVPACMAGLNVISARADHETAGTTAGPTTITIRNVTQAADILSTGITITAGALTASDGTIDLAQDDLTSGDRLDFNVDGVTTVAPKGLLVTLECRLP